MTTTMPIALTIAGSDSGGGAGIQADLKTFHQFGVFGTSAITAVTAQNTTGVRSVHLVPAAIVADQIAAVAIDLPPRAVKSGMLGTAELAETVGAALTEYSLSPYVLDPVMVATSGDLLLTPDAVAAIRTALLPLAALVTPNVDELVHLTALAVEDVPSLRRAARGLVEQGAAAVLAKGSHLPGDAIVDLLVTRTGERAFTHRRVLTRSTHGTGCTLSAAITAGLAWGHPLDQAIERAIAYLTVALERAPRLGGGGHGPVRHGVPVPEDPTAPR